MDLNGPDYFGRSVALSGDGNVALVGLGAYMYTWIGTVWAQHGKLVANDRAESSLIG